MDNLFQALADLIPHPIWIKNTALQYIYVNQPYASQWHKQSHDLLGYNDQELFDIENSDSFQALAQTKKITIKNIAYDLLPIKDASETVIALAGIGIDTYLLQKTINYTAKQYHLLHMIMKSLPCNIFYKDTTGHYCYTNHEDNIIGKTDHDIHKNRKLAEAFIKDDQNIMRHRQGSNHETKINTVEEGVFYSNVLKEPVINNSGEVIGIVGLAIDVTEKKMAQENLKKLSWIDILTGAYNRTFFEEKAQSMLREENFPLTVIMGDSNSLKMVNDTFGHFYGDQLLKRTVDILKSVCPQQDNVFRIGGDEFILLCKNTDEKQCQQIITNILEHCKDSENDLIPVSISLGYTVVEDPNLLIYDAITEAEKMLYCQKIQQKRKVQSTMLRSLEQKMAEKGIINQNQMDQLYKIVQRFTSQLALSKYEIEDVLSVIKYHDIGKIVIDDEILSKKGKLTNDEFNLVKVHVEKGYNIVRALGESEKVALGVLFHHERWDGNGYPFQLKEEEIPLYARIAAIIDTYDVMMNGTTYQQAKTKEEVLLELENCSGSQFDPQLIAIFLNCFS